MRTSEILTLMTNMNQADMNFTKSVMLHTFDGKQGFTAAQGE